MAYRHTNLHLALLDLVSRERHFLSPSGTLTNRAICVTCMFKPLSIASLSF